MKLKSTVILLIVISISASLGNPVPSNNEKPLVLETKETTESLDVNNTIAILEDAVQNYNELNAAYNEPAQNEELRVKRTFEAYQAIQNRSRNAFSTLGARLTRADESTSRIRIFLRNFFTRIATFLRNVWARLTKATKNAAVGARHLAETAVDFQSGVASTGALPAFSQYPFTPKNALNLTRLSTRLNTVVKRFREDQAALMSSLTGQKIDVKHNTQIHHANPHEPRFSINIHTIAPHIEQDHTEATNSKSPEMKMDKNFYEVQTNTSANKSEDEDQDNEIKSLTLVEKQQSVTSVAPGIFYAPDFGSEKDDKETPTEILLNDESDLDGYYSPLESVSGTEISEAVETLEASPGLPLPEKEKKKFYKVAPYIGGALGFILIIYGVMHFLKKDSKFSRSK